LGEFLGVKIEIKGYFFYSFYPSGNAITCD